MRAGISIITVFSTISLCCYQIEASFVQPFRLPHIWTFLLPPDTSSSSSSLLRMRFPSSAGDWNRETSKPLDFDGSLPVTTEARILVLGSPTDKTNARLFEEQNSSILGIGTKRSDFDFEKWKKDKTPPTIVYVTTKDIRDLLADVIVEFKDSILWIHARSAGIEHCTSETLAASPATMTNAKGHYSSTLAEYGMMACSYFAKDLPRLLQQQRDSNWERYCILELRGSTMGVVGLGDIGQATAKLAQAYGMKVIGLKRKRNKGGGATKRKRDDTDDNLTNNSKDNLYCDNILYSDENPNALNEVCAASDYVFVATPLTPQTKGLIGKEQFEAMKSTAVIINVGRGPVIDETALIDALKTNRIKGAGLDVTSTEPLPRDNPLWQMKNVLLSPYVPYVEPLLCYVCIFMCLHGSYNVHHLFLLPCPHLVCSTSNILCLLPSPQTQYGRDGHISGRRNRILFG